MPKHEEGQDEQQIPKERILIEVDGQEKWVFAYSISNAARFLGYTDKGLRNIIERHKNEGHPIQLYKPQIGRGTLILEETLKDLQRAVPTDD
jgi:hypothetical protein